MNFKQKWMAVAGAIVVSGAVLTGAAFAAEVAAPKTGHQPRVESRQKLTPGETEVLQRLREVRHAHREQARAESRALIDQAVKDGKITQEQADRLLKKGADRHHSWKSPEELKARLDAAVKNGKMTQEQANRLLKRWEEHHAQKN